MFTLQDGREHLYQWDLDRYIIVEDNTICEVHFCNRTSDCSLVVEVKDGLAPIPNILLQEARPIRAYAYCDDKYTLTEEQFTVKSRTRPDDYVYTETDTITVKNMIDRADKTLEQTSEALANSETALANATAATQTANDTIALAQEAVVDMDRLVADAAQSAYDAKESAEQAAAAVVNYYTKEEHNTNYSDAKEVAYFDFSGSLHWEEIPEEYNKILNRIHAGEQIVVYIKDGYNYAIADFIVNTTAITFRTHFTDLLSDGRTSIAEYVALLEDGVWLVKEYSDKTYKFATEEYVDEAIANIPTGGVDLSSYVTTDTEQEITGAKTFTSSIKVTESTNTATLSGRAVTFTDSSAPGVTLSNPINEYGLRIFLNGSGYVADGESKCLFFYDDNQHDYATLGKKASPWYRAYIKNLSDGITTKSMTEVLSAPTMDEVTQAIQDALNGIATAEGGSY